MKFVDRRGNQGDEMVGRKDKRFRNDGHLYGHQSGILKSRILFNTLVIVAHQIGLEPITYWLEVRYSTLLKTNIYCYQLLLSLILSIYRGIIG